MYSRLRGSARPPPIGVRYRCSQLLRDAMLWVHMHNMFPSGTDFWRYLDKAYNSVPGSGGSTPHHAIPCVHGLTRPLCVGASYRGNAFLCFYHCDMRNLEVRICNVVATPDYSRP
jgi:hypothetical protein